MAGKIIGISGPTVTVDLKGLTLFERVSLGERKLQGEVVRLGASGAVVQVYEETKGLRLGEPVSRKGTQLTVRLGPGLLNDIFDGLQRPLSSIGKEFGPFIRPGDILSVIPCDRTYFFSPGKKFF